jgi:hypothetical protein
MREQSTMLTQRIQVLEQQMEARDKELEEIKEAYQSKVKKCAAWEKVGQCLCLCQSPFYNNTVLIFTLITGIQFYKRSGDWWSTYLCNARFESAFLWRKYS